MYIRTVVFSFIGMFSILPNDEVQQRTLQKPGLRSLSSAGTYTPYHYCKYDGNPPQVIAASLNGMLVFTTDNKSMHAVIIYPGLYVS